MTRENYRLDPLDPSIRASGLDVIDLAIAKTIKRWVDFDLSIDNLNNKHYYETQNYFSSRLPKEPASSIQRIHGTPGYPFGITAGFTFHFSHKD